MAAIEPDVDVYEPPDPNPQAQRLRPRVQGTVAPDIAGKLAALHEKRGGPFAYVLEDVLRRGLEHVPELIPINRTA